MKKNWINTILKIVLIYALFIWFLLAIMAATYPETIIYVLEKPIGDFRNAAIRHSVLVLVLLVASGLHNCTKIATKLIPNFEVKNINEDNTVEKGIEAINYFSEKSSLCQGEIEALESKTTLIKKQLAELSVKKEQLNHSISTHSLFLIKWVNKIKFYFYQKEIKRLQLEVEDNIQRIKTLTIKRDSYIRLSNVGKNAMGSPQSISLIRMPKGSG